MTKILSENYDKTLQAVGLELLFCTPEKCEFGNGLTAIEISRKLNLKMEIVKKKLRVLQGKGIVRAVGINPKIWQFDEYMFRRMDIEDPVYKSLCDFENIDFDKYYSY